jgi:hypothetical protein
MALSIFFLAIIVGVFWLLVFFYVGIQFLGLCEECDWTFEGNALKL